MVSATAVNLEILPPTLRKFTMLKDAPHYAWNSPLFVEAPVMNWKIDIRNSNTSLFENFEKSK